MKYLADIFGLFGVGIIILAYFLSQVGKWSANGFPYLLTNLAGAFLIIYSLMFTWNLSSFVMEVLWISISVFGIAKKITENKKRRKNIGI